MAIEAAKWATALRGLGYAVTTVAGSGSVDRLVPGLGITDSEGPDATQLEAALADADLVVVENLCSLPLNPKAAAAVARTLAGRPAVLHHHDLAWQRAPSIHAAPPPTDPRWSHVTINELSRRQLALRGITATTIYNSFVVPPAGATFGVRDTRAKEVRTALGLGPLDLLVLQPTRAIARKGVAEGVRAAAQLGATFWLLGPAEDGFDDELADALAHSPAPVLHGPQIDGLTIEDAYGAADVVALPSSWEGFGNPSVESATHGRPLVIGNYPVARELAAFGFRWFGLGHLGFLADWLESQDPALLEQNRSVAERHFNLDTLGARIASVLPAH